MRKVVLLVLAAFLAFAAYAAAEPRDSVSRQFPLYENDGKADLTVDPKRFVSQMEIVDRWFDADSCELPRAPSTLPATGGSSASTR